MLLCRTHRQSLVHHYPHWELIHHAIDPENCERPTLATGHNGLAKGIAPVCVEVQGLFCAVIFVLKPCAMGFHSHCVDAGVGTSTTSHLLQHFQHAIDLLIVDGFRTYL